MSGQRRFSQYQKYDKNSVADQPGLKAAAAGFFIAVIFGLALRAALSPDRVKELIERASIKVHSDIHFQIGNAYVSLADGIFPELAVVVEKITAESVNPCWMSPFAEVNVLKLPLSFWDLLRGKILIHRMVIDEFNLSLRQGLGACATPAENAEIQSSPAAIQRQVAQSLNDLIPQKKKVPIDTVNVNRLKVHYLPIPFTSFEVRGMEVKLKSQDPKVITLSGLLSLGGETLSGDYSSHAQLYLEYSEIREPSWKTHLSGNWREGHYEISAQYVPMTHVFSLNSDVKHLPLSQVFPLLKKYRLMNSDFDGRQVWLSFHLETQGDARKWKSLPSTVDHLKLEGDFGEISSQKIEVLELEPFRVRPVDVVLKGIDVAKVFVFLNRPHPSPVLNSLGVFNGVAQFLDPENIHIEGEHTGLELIFSNLGHREIQAISFMRGSLDLRAGSWKVNVAELRPKDGLLDGSLNLLADHSWRNLKINTHIEDLVFSPQVQRLMTEGGQIPSISGDAKVELTGGQINALEAQLKLPKAEFPGFSLEKMKFNLSKKTGEFVIDMQVQNGSISRNDVRLGFLLEHFDNDWEKQGVFSLRSLKAVFKTDNFSLLSWRNVSAQVGPGKISSEGGWDNRGQLNGFVSLKSGQRKEKRLYLRGDRDKPILSSYQ